MQTREFVTSLRERVEGSEVDWYSTTQVLWEWALQGMTITARSRRVRKSLFFESKSLCRFILPQPSEFFV
jgi:hypothetical protein